MSLVYRTFACSACEGTFELLQDREDGPPKFCVNCGAKVDPGSSPIPSKIAVGGSAIARATDTSYRLLESTSAARAEELGAPHLKITDLKDNLREGDVAAKMPENTITRFARETKSNLGINYLQWGGGMAGARVAPVMAGPNGQSFVGPGHMALAALQPGHQERVANTVAHPTAVHRT